MQSGLAKPNFLRLGSDLAGLAKIGLMDCKVPANLNGICQRHSVPRSNYPYFWLYRPGNATVKGAGKKLFGRELQPHVAFPLVAALLEAALPPNASGTVREPEPEDEAQLAVVPEEGEEEDDGAHQECSTYP
jgi:hypothetical protein